MARITIEDCLENVNNRYDLVLLAAKRARQIAMGSETMVEREKDKATVTALREIAEGFVNSSNIDKIAQQHEFDEEQEEDGIKQPDTTA